MKEEVKKKIDEKKIDKIQKGKGTISRIFLRAQGQREARCKGFEKDPNSK